MSEHRSATDAFKRDLLARNDGVLTMAEVRMLVIAASVQAVMDEVTAGRMLVVDDLGTLLSPAFQGEDAASGVREVLAAAPTTGGCPLPLDEMGADHG